MSESRNETARQGDLFSRLPAEIDARSLETPPEPPSQTDGAGPIEDGNGKKYLTVGEVARRFSVSPATVWRWAKNGRFPKPFRFSERVTRWALSDLIAYEAELRNGSEG